MSFDLVIRGANVYPGDASPLRAHVGIRGDRIVAVRPVSEEWGQVWDAAEWIDGSGLMLCPGFIDLHAHSALRPFSDPLLTPKVAQGFTTELIGVDGLAPAPVAPDGWSERAAYLKPIEGDFPAEPAWRSIAEYLTLLAAARPATNLVASVGHSAVREFVLGRDDRPAMPDELARMCREVRVGLESGARAVSFGLIYVPGLFAGTEELTAVAREGARFGVPLVVHVRNEGAGILEALQEVVQVARDSGAALHLSHLKLVGNEQILEQLLALVDGAAREVPLTFDQYPYGAGSTTLAAILPPWAQAGGTPGALARLADPDARARIVADISRGITGWENLYGSCGPERIVIADAPPSHAEIIGSTLTEIGLARGIDPLQAALDLLVETGSRVTMIDHYASDAVVRQIFRHPLAMVGSDGIFGAHPHPRLYGTAARVLGRLALRERLIAVEEAVARLTSRPAELLGLNDRGRIREGLRADLVLLDPAAFIDTATFEDPQRTPPGIEAVIIGGKVVYRNGCPTGSRPGQVLRISGASE
jgi:N-acyl-D-amino-acid deacylase